MLLNHSIVTAKESERRPGDEATALLQKLEQKAKHHFPNQYVHDIVRTIQYKAQKTDNISMQMSVEVKTERGRERKDRRVL